MRSIKSSQILQCPNGCDPFEADLWSLINAAENPELTDALLGGELNLFCCPSCQEFFHGDTNLIYVDGAADLLVFVFTEKERAQKTALLADMRRDYEQLKETLLESVHVESRPLYVFGLEELKGVIVAEQNRKDESDAVAAATNALGMKAVRLESSWARERGFPVYVPAAKGDTAPEYAAAAEKVLEVGLQSPLLQHFVHSMMGEGATAPQLANDTKKI